MSDLHEVQDFDAYALTADAAKHERPAPAKLRFHEVTLRTPEEARMDEMREVSTNPIFGAKGNRATEEARAKFYAEEKSLDA